MWIEYGSNNIGINAVWVQSVSMYYSVDQDNFAALVPNSKKLPKPVYVAKNNPKPAEAKTVASTEHATEPVKTVAASAASKVTAASHTTNLLAAAKE